MRPTRDREDDPRHHRDGGYKASRLEPQNGVSPDGSRAVQGVFPAVHLSETTGECICSTGTQDMAQHIIQECEDDEKKGLRRRQEAIGGAFPFRLTSRTKDEEVRGRNQDGR
jgi:hypothetical protein